MPAPPTPPAPSSLSKTLRSSARDLRGATRMVIDATTGITDIVEAMHARIARVPILPGLPSLPGLSSLPGMAKSNQPDRAGGLTGAVYGSVRGITRLVGAGLDGLLAFAELPGEPTQIPHPGRTALVAALNGVVGDRLAKAGNPLASELSLIVGGEAVDVGEGPSRRLRLAPAAASPRLVILLHGLCMHDGQWMRHGHHHGAALAADLGFARVGVQYNSGLPVADNARALAQHIQGLVDQWPVPLRQLVLFGFSMGGLVARSALHQAAQAGLSWPGRVTDLVCLGTPHHGAALERAGHVLDVVLGALPYASPLARLGRVRSAGITDLRHGRVLAVGSALPLPEGIRCFAMAGTSRSSDAKLTGRPLPGDGLVSVDSALGRHRDPARQLAFRPERTAIAHGVKHLDLLSQPQVYDQLRHWLAPG